MELIRADTALFAERMRTAAFLLAAVAGLGFVYVFNPGTSGIYPTCPFLWFTGCYCPGCGTLRALHQITRGHLLAAFGLNPLMMLSLPFIGYYAVSKAKLVVTGRTLPMVFLRSWMIWGLLGLVLSFWVLRNVPVNPFTLLAP